MKKTFYSLGLLSLISLIFSGQSIANMSCSIDAELPAILSEDTCYYEKVLMGNLEYPDDITENTLEVTAKTVGAGTVVLKSKRNSGFPRLIILGDTEVENVRKSKTGTSVSAEWDGNITLPAVARVANKRNFFDESQMKDTGTTETEGGTPINVNVLGTYILGQKFETYSFSQDAFMSFIVDVPDGTQVWQAQETDDLDDLIENETREEDITWDFVREEYCVVSNRVCTVKIAANTPVNRISLVRPIYSSCPTIRIENGRYSNPPECKIVCNEGFAFPFGERKCVPMSEVDNSQENLTDKDDYLSSVNRTRQGYFRFRDTRGGQLELLAGSGDLSSAEQEFVDAKNAAVGGKLGNQEAETSNDSVDQNSLWKQFQELVWTNDTTGEYHKSRYVRDESADEIINGDRVVTNEDELEIESASARGGLLPSTGSGAFIALVIAGLATMGFALRRRRP